MPQEVGSRRAGCIEPALFASPSDVMLAYLTNAEGSIIISIVFLSLAATVILVGLRHHRRASGVQREQTLLERIEAMTNEEYEAWRADGQRRARPLLEAGGKGVPVRVIQGSDRLMVVKPLVR